ncbi:MAG: ATP-binding cassette domain-containing protein [Lachnospiraceae bacterium]|nr:ATP-binding cassette domain-containing protein [Lachnospiraceae bacterium]
MGLYDEQISERIEYDDYALMESYLRLTDAVTGKSSKSMGFDSDAINMDGADKAISLLLKYYHVKGSKGISDIKNLDDKLEHELNPHGIMRRRVCLKGDWYKDAYGPFIGTIKDSGDVVAIIPAHPKGYNYYSVSEDRFIRITSKNASEIDEDAYSFYRPFPMRKLSVADLLIYIKNIITVEDMAVVLLLYLVTTLIGMLTPKFTGLLYGNVVKFGSYQLLMAVGAFMISASLSQVIFSTLKDFVMGRLNTKISISVEAATMMRIFSLPTSFFREYTSGELANIKGRIGGLCSLLISTFLSISLSSLFSLLYIWQIFKYAKALVVPAVLIVFISTAFNTFVVIRNMKRSKLSMKYSAKTAGVGYSLLSGVEKIKLTGSEKRAFAKWSECYAKGAKLDYNPPFFIKVSSVISTAIGAVGTIVMYFLTIKSGIELYEYTAFMAAYGMMAGAFAGLSAIVMQVANIKPSIEMCKPILEAIPEAAENKEVISNVKGNISIDNVTFRYNDNSPYIFENFSLKINKGEYVAIVGKTGCGKSTLVRLMLGFEKMERGAIYFDGRDISSIDIKSLRRNIGTVIQNGKIFQGDIFSNITVTAPKATLDDAWEAARLAGFDEDIKAMPMGMNTMISEGQGGISGGQKQRLMIARAVVGKPNVLILDEATSALDNITQKQVSDALSSLKCTRIVIAHRLSTIKECDRIIVIDDGKIKEEGTYEDLIALNGYFKKLVERQMVE